MQTYIYPSFRPFADAAAEAHKIPPADRHLIGQSRSFKAIDRALAQLPEQADKVARGLIDPATTAQVLERVTAFRAAIAAELSAADKAIEAVRTGLGLD